MAQAWPLSILPSHGHCHGSKVDMESKLCPIKAGEHQSTPRDGLKFWERDIPFLRVPTVAILPPLGGTCLKGWEHRAKQNMEV